jgi:tetratricopeptide (TPR) repeat protein
MWRKLEELKATLADFVDQRESLLLVVSTTDAEMVYVLKSLEGMDDTSASDLFLIFAEPFTKGPAYASAIVKNLRAQMDVAKAELGAREEAPLAPLPAVCDDEGAPPNTRLRAAIDHVSSLVPAAGGHRVVWGFLPGKVTDQEGYARLVGEFIPWKGPELWMRGLRVLARDDRARPFLLPALLKNKAPGVLRYELDMSPSALNDAWVKEAADRRLPEGERMQALMQLAGLDYAYRRYPEAIEKYTVLYSYYAEHKVPTMQAIALQGVGDTLHRMDDRKRAKEKYLQGLSLAMPTGALPILLNLTTALGDVSLELRDYHDAAGFFSLSEQIATKLLNPFAKADGLEKLGVARYALGDTTGAVLAWRGAATLCQTFDYHERHRSALERLIAAYKAMNMDAERRAAEAELKTVVQALKAAAKAEHAHALKGPET